MKKFFIYLCLILLLSVPVYAAGGTITADIPVRSALIDNQYHVTVSITDNPGFASLQLELFYNDSTVRCVHVRPGDVVQGMLSDTNPRASGSRTSAILSVAGFENVSEDGTLAVFIFEAPGGGDPGFSLSLTEIRSSSGRTVPCSVNLVNHYGSTGELPPPPPDDEEETEETREDIRPSDPPENDRENDETEDDRVDIWIDTETEYVPDNDRYGDDDDHRYDRDDDDDPWYDDPDDPEEEPEEDLTEPEDAEDDAETAPPVRLPDAFYDENMEPARQFTDTSGHWAKDYIAEASSRGVISGYPDGSFQPDRTMTRAEFATILWNMAGRPVSTASLPFTDVGPDDWFRPQIAWAYETGCINGTSAAKFSPHSTVTREQAVTILCRYSGETDGLFNLSFFADRGQISSYALPAVRWALSAGILSGVDDTHLNPRGEATRAQLSALIVRYIQYIQYLQLLNP